MRRVHRTRWVAAGITSGLLAILWMSSMTVERPDPSSVIVQGKDTTAVGKLVRQFGGTVTHELGVINAVAADLTAKQIDELRESPAVSRVYANRIVDTAAKKTSSLVDTDSTGGA